MKPKATLRSLLLVASSVLVSVPFAHAISGNWNTNNAGNWSTGLWTSGSAPGTTAGDIVGLTSNIDNHRIVTIDDISRTVGILNIGDSNNTHRFTLARTGSLFLTLNNNGSAAQINETGSQNDTISAPITLADNLAASVAGSLTLSGVIGESVAGRTITKTGAGSLTLSVANTYTGQTNINVGQVIIGNNTALGTTAGKTVVASGGQAFLQTTGLAVAEAFDIAGNGTSGTNGAIGFGGGSIIMGISGLVTLTGSATINNNGGTTSNFTGGIALGANILTFEVGGGANNNINTTGISGTNGSINKTSTGTLSLNAASSYGGGTTVSAGTLNIGNTAALGSTSGQLTVNSTGTLNMAGNSITVGNLTGSGGIISGTSGTRLLTIGQGDTGGGNFLGQINNGTGGTTSLTKTGNGAITLSGTNGYGGATIVSGGKLTISSTGTINSTSGISIGAGEFNYNSSTALTQGVSFSGTGGTLSGSSTVNPAVNVTAGNTLAIGNSVGVMNFASNLVVAGTYLFELDNTLNTADLGDVAGSLTLGGILDLVQLGTYALGDKFTLFAYDGTLSGVFTGIADDTNFTDAGGMWMMNYNDITAGLNGGTSVNNTFVTITAIPEPRAALLGGLGLLALLRRRR